MPQMEKMIDADLIGIGKLLKQTRFSVPPHQRPYAWLEGEVTDLYRDINDARDHFDADGQKERAREIEREYLSKRDIRTMEDTAHLHLIPEDRDFFVKRVVRPPGHTDRNTPATRDGFQNDVSFSRRSNNDSGRRLRTRVDNVDSRRPCTR